MSSRRAVGEDNILAMLERDSARRSGSRGSNLRLAWYGAAAAFAGILVGGVAWLAYDNHKGTGQLQAEHDTHVAAMPPMLSGAGAPAQPDVSMLPVPAAEVPRAAVIVDESPPAPPAASTAVPPLVMLSRSDVDAKRAAPPPAPPEARSSTLPPLVMLPPQEAAEGRAAAKPAARPARETTNKAPATPRPVQAQARASEKKSDKAQRPAARSAKATAQRSATKTAPEPARKPKAAAPAPQVDSDVALISAIIAQSERHRGERDAASACSGAKCPPKPTQP